MLTIDMASHDSRAHLCRSLALLAIMMSLLARRENLVRMYLLIPFIHRVDKTENLVARQQGGLMPPAAMILCHSRHCNLLSPQSMNVVYHQNCGTQAVRSTTDAPD